MDNYRNMDNDGQLCHTHFYDILPIVPRHSKAKKQVEKGGTEDHIAKSFK